MPAAAASVQRSMRRSPSAELPEGRRGAARPAAFAGAGIAVLVAVAWTIALTSQDWLSMRNTLYTADVKLLSASFRKGSGFQVAIDKFSIPANLLDAIFTNTLYLGDVSNTFCLPVVQAALQTCDEWQRIRLTSMLMAMFGSITVASLLLGAVGMCYYVALRATSCGRKLIWISFVVAPSSAFIGLVQYTIFTWDVGAFNNVNIVLKVVLSPSSGYPVVFIAAWLLLVASTAPLWILAFCWSKAPFEHSGGEGSEELDAGDEWGDSSAIPQGAELPARQSYAVEAPTQQMQPASSARKQQQPPQQDLQQEAMQGYQQDPQQEAIETRQEYDYTTAQVRAPAVGMGYGAPVVGMGYGAPVVGMGYGGGYSAGGGGAVLVEQRGYAGGYTGGYTGGFVQQPVMAAGGYVQQPVMAAGYFQAAPTGMVAPQMPSSIAFRQTRGIAGAQMSAMPPPSPQALHAGNIGPMVPLVPGANATPSPRGYR